MSASGRRTTAFAAVPTINRGQRGATSLFITLVLLVIVMMLGITATMLSSTQFRLAGNVQLESIAFSQAEAAAATAQGWLSVTANHNNSGFDTYSSATTPYLYPITASVDPMTMTWNDTNSLALSSTQRYIIQKIAANTRLPGNNEVSGPNSSCDDLRADVYRITALGTSAKGTARLIQTTWYTNEQSTCAN